MKPKKNHTPRLPMREAVAKAREQFPDIPASSLIAAITQGRVSYMRSGPSPKARYFVLLDDLLDYCRTLVVIADKPQPLTS